MSGSVFTLRARLIAEHAIQNGLRSIRVFFDAEHDDAVRFLQLNRIWLEAMAHNPRIQFSHCICSANRRFSTNSFLASSVGRWKGSVADNIRPLLETKETRVSYQEFLDTLVVGRSFEECFEAAPAPSLWVFLSAGEADDALRWCETHRIAVPKKVSIISQQNNALCIRQGISSCIEDWRTIGYQMAHALIGDFPVARTRRGYVRLRARFLGRNTTF
jgi:hypothetical protein